MGPIVVELLLGKFGALGFLLMLFMAVVSTGAAECMAVSSLITFDIFRAYIRPEASPSATLFVARASIVGYGVFSSLLALILVHFGISLGYVYTLTGILIGSAGTVPIITSVLLFTLSISAQCCQFLCLSSGER